MASVERHVEDNWPQDSGAQNNETSESTPLVTVLRSGPAIRIAAVNPAAAALGLYSSLALADVRARHPDIRVADANAEAEQQLLERLADWSCRWTPYTGLDAPDGVMLDITGCAHLFAGEAALRHTVHERLTAQGFTVKTAIASTPACAFFNLK